MEADTIQYNGKPISAEELRTTGFLYINLANAMDRAEKQRLQYLENPDDPKEHAEALAARERVLFCTQELQADYALHNAAADAETELNRKASRDYYRRSRNMFYTTVAISTGILLATIVWASL